MEINLLIPIELINKLCGNTANTKASGNTVIRWAEHVARMGAGKGVYRVLVGKSEGKRPLERPRHRWDDNIKIDLQEVGCGDIDWIKLAQERDRWWAFVNSVMNLRFP